MLIKDYLKNKVTVWKYYSYQFLIRSVTKLVIYLLKIFIYLFHVCNFCKNRNLLFRMKRNFLININGNKLLKNL